MAGQRLIQCFARELEHGIFCDYYMNFTLMSFRLCCVHYIVRIGITTRCRNADAGETKLRPSTIYVV